MLIIGAGGFAKEVLQIFHHKNDLEGMAFYDDISTRKQLFEKFPVLKNEEQVLKHFQLYGSDFTLGIGKPGLRYKMYHKLKDLGGNLVSSISPLTVIGNYDVKIGVGTNILNGAILSNSTTIGICGIIYYNTIVTHDCNVGDFVELSPNVQLLGGCKIGSFSQIGSNSVILPNIVIGENVIVGAGSVVTRNVPSDCVVLGTPARIIKPNEPLKFK